jgi:hypothetical protein
VGTVKLKVEVVETLGLAAVNFVDSLAHPSLLIKHCAVETEELDVHHLALLADGAHMEHLATSLDVGIVAADHLALAREASLGQVIKVQKLQIL